MKTLSKLNITSTESYDTFGLDITLAKTDKNRWYLADMYGKLLSTGFTSESKALKAIERIELRRMRGNLHGLRFGSKIDEDTIKGYADRIWGNEFKLTNIRFKKDHYWMADIEATETGKKAKELRLDYFINYMRIPEGLETEITNMMATANGARYA